MKPTWLRLVLFVALGLLPITCSGGSSAVRPDLPDNVPAQSSAQSAGPVSLGRISQVWANDGGDKITR